MHSTERQPNVDVAWRFERQTPVVAEGPKRRVDVHVREVNVLQTCNGTGILALANLCHWEKPSVLILYDYHLGGILRNQAGRGACPKVTKACDHDKVVCVNALEVCRHVIHPVLQNQASYHCPRSKPGATEAFITPQRLCQVLSRPYKRGMACPIQDSLGALPMYWSET